MLETQILVVEDQVVVATNIANRLRNLGYRVPVVVSSGEEAILQAVETRPDLVLMDVRLEGEMDGVEAAAQIRDRLNIPVIYLTAYADRNTLARAKITEPFGYILKPFEPRELQSAIEMALYKHRMEQRLKESETRYRTLFNGVPVGLYRTTPDGQVLDANPSLVQMLGYADRASLLDSNVNDAFLDPEQRREWRARLEREGVLQHSKLILRRPDGTIVWVEDNAYVARDEDGEVLYYEGSMIDITEQVRAEAKIRRRNQELSALNEIVQTITSTLDLQETLTLVTYHATRLLDVAATALVLRDEEAGDLWFAAGSGENADFVRGKRLPVGQGIVGWVVQHGESALVPDVSQDERWFGGFDEQGDFHTRSALCVPLQTRGRTIGALEVLNKTRGAFDEDDLRLLSLLAAPAATAIENAQLFEAERAAREHAETLRQVAATLASSLDLDQVLGSILTCLEQVIPYDGGVVFLQEEAGLRGMAVRGLPSADQVLGELFPSDNSLCVELRQTQRPLILKDAQADPRFKAWAGTDYVRGWLSVPFAVRGKFIGFLALDSCQVGAYGEAEAASALAFAHNAAVAIHNAQLFEQVRSGREKLQALSRRLVEVQEAERERIARELHDETGQTLSSLLLGLSLIEKEADRPQSVVVRAIELQEMVDELLENLHRLAMNLRPATLDHLGLVPALENYVELFGRQQGLKVEFEAVGLDEERLPPTVEVTLYRVVQEALTNVARHAGATYADVLLERRGNQVVTIIEDDGVGFDPQAAIKSGRLGLFGMKERAEMLGGNLTIESAVQTGTTIFVEIPYDYSDLDRG